MNELANMVAGVNGPFPHMMLFLTIACVLGWWTKEIVTTFIILIVLSIGAECLQMYFPRMFNFEFLDILWNIIGSLIGLTLVQLALFISSGWIAREKGWDEIRKEQQGGNFS